MAKPPKKEPSKNTRKVDKMIAAQGYVKQLKIASRIDEGGRTNFHRSKRSYLFSGITPRNLRKAYGKRFLLKDVPAQVSGDMPQRYRKHFNITKGEKGVQRKLSLHAAPREHGALIRKIANPLRRVLKMPELEPKLSYHFHLKEAPVLDRYWPQETRIDGKVHTEFMHEHQPTVNFTVPGTVAEIVEKYRADKS